mmetsp:Transcript_41615/g.120678  ORF Transcript_41615/g.120678 Transcript_41615/m.120678 type:complete len:416 (-) Transcript_41615:188-1435(-)
MRHPPRVQRRHLRRVPAVARLQRQIQVPVLPDQRPQHVRGPAVVGALLLARGSLHGPHRDHRDALCGCWHGRRRRLCAPPPAAPGLQYARGCALVPGHDHGRGDREHPHVLRGEAPEVPAEGQDRLRCDHDAQPRPCRRRHTRGDGESDEPPMAYSRRAHHHLGSGPAEVAHKGHSAVQKGVENLGGAAPARRGLRRLRRRRRRGLAVYEESGRQGQACRFRRVPRARREQRAPLGAHHRVLVGVPRVQLVEGTAVLDAVLATAPRVALALHGLHRPRRADDPRATGRLRRRDVGGRAVLDAADVVALPDVVVDCRLLGRLPRHWRRHHHGAVVARARHGGGSLSGHNGDVRVLVVVVGDNPIRRVGQGDARVRLVVHDMGDPCHLRWPDPRRLCFAEVPAFVAYRALHRCDNRR